MMKHGLFVVGFVMMLLPDRIITAPLTDEKSLDILPIQPQNKTIEQIMTDQTEAVRKIIEAQRQTDIDYPIVTKTETSTEEKMKDKVINFKSQCEELLKQNLKASTISTTEKSTEEVHIVKPVGPFIKPLEFTGNKRKLIGLMNENVDNVKLIKFEPVILQKTVLKDGQIVYYWHKSLPFPQYLVVHSEEQEKIRPIITTTTTTTTTTTAKPDRMHGNQLRFVVPMAYSTENNEQHSMPVQVSVPPALSFIKTLVIPNKYMSYRNAEQQMENNP